MTKLADFVRDARNQLGLTQEELDERIGMSSGYTGSLEIGRSKRPKPKTIKALAEVLHVSPTLLNNLSNDISDADLPHPDVTQAILRIDQIPSRVERLRVFRSLPDDVRRAIRQLALDLDDADDEQDEE